MFWCSDDGLINYAFGTNGNMPDVANRVTLDIESMFSPSVCADHRSLYMVYVDSNKKIHLMMYNLYKGEGWTELPFPDVETDVRPAIIGGIENWLTIAFCNQKDGVQKIASNKDIERPGAWPSELSISLEGGWNPNVFQNYWFPLYGFTWKTDESMCLIRYNNYTIARLMSNFKSFAFLNLTDYFITFLSPDL